MSESKTGNAYPLASYYRDYLREEGYHPEIDDEYVFFKHGGYHYVIRIDKDDEEFFRIFHPFEYAIESQEEYHMVKKTCADLTEKKKVIKIIHMECHSEFVILAESILPAKEAIKKVLPRLIRGIGDCFGDFTKTMQEWREAIDPKQNERHDKE